MAKYSYRYKKPRRGKANEWQPCTVKQKEKLEKMRPYMFEFKENKAPEPTPNMENKQK